MLDQSRGKEVQSVPGAGWVQHLGQRAGPSAAQSAVQSLQALPSPSLSALCVTHKATPRRGHGSTDLPFGTFQASMGQAFLPTLSQEKTKATN